MTVKRVRILTYKRTHTGDPDRLGRFGIHDCMGRVRSLSFDAVIGVGGTGPEPKRVGIARKLTWIGIGPRRTFWGAGRAELIEFEVFFLMDERGPNLITVAPHLAALMYDRHRRFVLDAYTPSAYADALQLLDMAMKQALVEPANTHRRHNRRSRKLKGSIRSHCRPKPPVMGCLGHPTSETGVASGHTRK